MVLKPGRQKSGCIVFLIRSMYEGETLLLDTSRLALIQFTFYTAGRTFF